ncbi:hypothetical protein N6H14_27120 [Paenibacillus sp. CC-CFT747]|nr:hypothetical protein N6H14_27120 [Paenibacillus sp. CC-CFT747]
MIRAENGLTETWTVFVTAIQDNNSLQKLVNLLREQGWIGTDGIANSLEKQALHEQYRAFKQHVASLETDGQITHEAASLLYQAADVLLEGP